MKAFVEATPSSGPQCVYSVQSAVRVSAEPTVLQIARIFAPFSFASYTAASVSAVSPDWLMAITRSSGPIVVSR